jgi:hypothetical protein
LKKFKFPTAYTILFVLIPVVAALTWIIPAGQYDRELSEALDKEFPVPGTFHVVDSTPQGLFDVLMAPIAGLYNPESYEAQAIDVALFVLIIGGFLAVVTKTGAIDAGIGRLPKALEDREIWMIPILMIAFAAGGTSYGADGRVRALLLLQHPQPDGDGSLRFPFPSQLAARAWGNLRRVSRSARRALSLALSGRLRPTCAEGLQVAGQYCTMLSGSVEKPRAGSKAGLFRLKSVKGPRD